MTELPNQRHPFFSQRTKAGFNFHNDFYSVLATPFIISVNNSTIGL
jgi:hypothetical protein